MAATAPLRPPPTGPPHDPSTSASEGDPMTIIRHHAERTVGVDTAGLLIIDPGYLPADVIEHVIGFVRDGLADVVNTRADGGYLVESVRPCRDHPAGSVDTGRSSDGARLRG